MLKRSGIFNEEELIEAIKSGPYLPLYGREEKEECRIPFKDLDEGKLKIKYAVFLWLAENWVFVNIID